MIAPRKTRPARHRPPLRFSRLASAAFAVASLLAADADAALTENLAVSPVAMSLGNAVTADPPGWYHPGRGGSIRLGPKTVLAHFGEIHPRILSAFDIKESVVGFELLLDILPPLKVKAGKGKAGAGAAKK